MRDPIGITGWPKEKGRDGERTPMQWDASNAQAGFSTNPHTWLPVQPAYREVNVQSESANHGSLLNWYQRLIAYRRSIPALENGKVVMLDPQNAHVLSYARVARRGKSVLVALNMSALPQRVDLGLPAAGVRGAAATTLMSRGGRGLVLDGSGHVTLPAFAAWVAAYE